MGSGAGKAHPARITCVDTGCLVTGHSNENGKFGCGGAALGRKDDVLYVLGNKGLGIFSTTKLSACTEDSSVKVADMRTGSVISTGVVSHDSGCDLLLWKHGENDLMYVAGGKGLTVFDVSNAESPISIGNVMVTGALTHNGGAALKIYLEKYLYVAGGKGLVVYEISQTETGDKARTPVKLSEVAIDTGAVSLQSGCALKLDPENKLLYVLGGKGLAVMDLSADPAKPERIGDVLRTGCCDHVGCPAIANAHLNCENGFLFVAGGKALGVVDLSDPRKPVMSQKINTGVLAQTGGSAMAIDNSDKLYGDTKTLLIAGGKGLGVFTLPDVKDLLGGTAPERKGKIHTGATSHDNDSAILLDEATRFLYVAGGNGLAVFDLAKFDGATLDETPPIEEEDVEIQIAEREDDEEEKDAIEEKKKEEEKEEEKKEEKKEEAEEKKEEKKEEADEKKED